MTIEYKDSKRIVALSSDALVAHLKFNDNVTDSAGSNNGTVTGTTTYVTGKVGKGISLNGSSYVTLANESNFDFEHTNPFSITFWIKMNSGSDGGTYYVAAKQNAGGGQVGLGLLLLSNGELRFGFDTASGNHRITSSNSVVTVSSGWTHVSITYDGSSNLSGCKIYINGTLDVTGSSSSITSTVLNNYAFVWGASSDGSLDTPATYDDTRIYSRELDQNEVSVIYNGGTGTEGDLKPTDVQDNSLLIEKDTARRYWFDANPLFTDDFSSSTGWTTVGSNVTITGGELSASSVDASGDNRIYYPLGFTLEDNFVARWEHTPKGVSNNSVFLPIMNFTAGTGNLSTSTNQDRVYLFTDSSSQTLYLRGQDGTTAGTNSNSQALTTDTKYYLELVKNGTSGTVYVRTGSHSGTLVNTLTTTIASGITGLTHVQSGAMTGGNAGTGSYTVDNIEIYNGVTTASGGGQWTMQPTFEDDFSSSTGWTQTGTSVTVSSGIAGGTTVDLNSDDRIDKSITTISDSIWTSYFDFKLNSFSNSADTSFTLLSINDGTGDLIAGDALIVQCAELSSTPQVRLRTYLSGTANVTSSSITINLTQTYYGIVRRLSTTEYDLRIFSDSARTTQIGSTTLSGANANVGGFDNVGTGATLGFGNASDTANYTLDNVEFYNGVTSIN